MAFFEKARSVRPLSSKVLGTLGAGLLKGLIPTYRWKRVGEIPPQLLDDSPALFAFWHSQQLLMPNLYTRIGRRGVSKGLLALASTHRDGQIIAQITELFGLMSVAGSSSKGGYGALLALGRGIKSGYDVALAPDGPKGPAYQVKHGLVSVARKFEVPIFPISYATDEHSSWRFKKAWDQMFLPKPGARVAWGIAEPLRFTERDEIEGASNTLQAALNGLNQKVKDALGV